MGITSHAADALGDVVFVDLPSVGKSFVAGDSFGSVESVKAASDVYSPVAGEVLEINGVSLSFIMWYVILKVTLYYLLGPGQQPWTCKRGAFRWRMVHEA